MSNILAAHRHWTSQDRLRLHYRDYSGPADRPPIVCLHGLTRNSRDFGQFAQRYAGSWRIIAPDFRGRGRSDWDPDPERYSPRIYAEDIRQLLAELAVERCVFVGTSLGGLVTMAIAATAPGLVAAAILNDIGPELADEGLDRIASYVGRAAAFKSWEEAATAIASGNAVAHPANTPDDWLRMATRLCVERGRAIRFDYDPAIANNFHAARQGPLVDAWPVFDALRDCPLLILRGELSDLLPASVAERMAARHPAAELVSVPDVGHAPDLSEPEALAAIDRLLAKVSSQTSAAVKT